MCGGEGGNLSSPGSLVMPSRVSLRGWGHPRLVLPLQSCLQGPLLALTCFPVSELVSVLISLIPPFSWDLGNSWDGLSCEDEAKHSHRRKQCEAVGSTDTRETQQDRQTQRSLGRYWDGWRQSQDQPPGRYHGAASSLPGPRRAQH